MKPPRRKPRARYYRYAGIAVRLYKGALKPVRIGGKLVRADGSFPRYARHLAPLPARLRRELREHAADFEHRARKDRLKAQGIEVEEAQPEFGQVAVPTGAAW